MTSPTAIFADAPHPNAARVFQNFLYTAKAQQLWSTWEARARCIPTSRSPRTARRYEDQAPARRSGRHAAAGGEIKKRYTALFGNWYRQRASASRVDAAVERSPAAVPASRFRPAMPFSLAICWSCSSSCRCRWPGSPSRASQRQRRTHARQLPASRRRCVVPASRFHDALDIRGGGTVCLLFAAPMGWLVSRTDLRASAPCDC